MTRPPIATTERGFKQRCRNRGLNRFTTIRHRVLNREYIHANDGGNRSATLVTDLATGDAYTLAAWLFAPTRRLR